MSLFTFGLLLYMESSGSVSHPAQLISLNDDLVEINPAAYLITSQLVFLQIEGGSEQVLLCLRAI